MTEPVKQEPQGYIYKYFYERQGEIPVTFYAPAHPRKFVIKPINRFADVCPERRVAEKIIPLLDLTLRQVCHIIVSDMCVGKRCVYE